MQTLAAKRNEIETAVTACMKTGKVSEADIRRALYALDLAGYEVLKSTAF